MDSRFVNVDEAVALADTLVPEGKLNKAIARAWAYSGLRDIGPGEHWFAEKELIPNANLSVHKPSDMYKAIDIALYHKTEGGQKIEYRFSYKGLGKRIHSDGNTVREDGIYSPASGAPIDVSEDAYCFHLGSNGSQVNCIKLKYWRLPIGDDGLPLIPEHQVLAIAFFIRWMWAVKENVANDRALSRQDYLNARREARASSKMPSGIEMEQVGKEWTSLLNSPRFKQF
jgi:hypothetical protein